MGLSDEEDAKSKGGHDSPSKRTRGKRGLVRRLRPRRIRRRGPDSSPEPRER